MIVNGNSNRLANRQSDSIRIAPKPFRFSDEDDSNRLYIVCFEASKLEPQKVCKLGPGGGAASSATTKTCTDRDSLGANRESQPAIRAPLRRQANK
jgi:hypothetical protein